MKLHNALRSPAPAFGLAACARNPSSNVLFNRGTEIHPQHGLWVTKLFLLKKREANGQNSDDVSYWRQCKDRV